MDDPHDKIGTEPVHPMWVVVTCLVMYALLWVALLWVAIPAVWEMV